MFFKQERSLWSDCHVKIQTPVSGRDSVFFFFFFWDDNYEESLVWPFFLYLEVCGECSSSLKLVHSEILLMTDFSAPRQLRSEV